MPIDTAYAHPYDECALQLLEKLLRGFSGRCNVERGYTLCGATFAAAAQFFSRGERYFISKKATLWAAEQNEHILFAFQKKLTRAAALELQELVRQAEPQLVKPHGEHMCTVLTMVVLAGEIDADAVPVVKRFRFRKSYRLSLWGWCEGHMAVLQTNAGQAVCSRGAANMGKILVRL